jgi:RimJ/RimL family protein N-acetyltransferase
MRAIPTINTPRVTLRAMRPQDFQDFAAIWQAPEVLKHLGGQPWSEPDAWTSFLRNAGHWQMTGFGLWGIEPHGSGRLMGQVGFFYGMRDLGEDFDTWPEASWILHPDAQGMGYGQDAAEAAHDWFDRVITGPLVCKFEPENRRSQRVAALLGYKPLREADFNGRASQLMIRKSPPSGA